MVTCARCTAGRLHQRSSSSCSGGAGQRRLHGEPGQPRAQPQRTNRAADAQQCAAEGGAGSFEGAARQEDPVVNKGGAAKCMW